jgi:stage IV sporulation protein FB
MFVLLFAYPSFALVFLLAHFFVLLHEFGHVIMAQHLGVGTGDITLYPIGGLAKVAIPRNSIKEMLIVLAGPGVNFALSLVFLLVVAIVNPVGAFYSFLSFCCMCNIVLFVFNLLPIFPSDGGRLLRATIFFFMKDDYYKSTLAAVRIGQVLEAGMVVFGLCFGYFMLSFIAVFLFVAAESELNLVRLSSDVVE